MKPVRKFTGTDRNGPNYRNGPERTLIIPVASSIFSYFDTVYMCRLIPGPISMIYIVSLNSNSILVYHIDTDTGAYILHIRHVSHETSK